MTTLFLTVADIKAETPLIRRVELAGPSGGALPGFAAGAHVTLRVPGVGERKYSLVNASPRSDATTAPGRYALGVRLDAEGGGGSRYIHGLAVGDLVEVLPPQNNFPLKPATGPVALVGGGIGITPLISMAATLQAGGRPFQMVYAARAASELAFMPEIQALAGASLTVHVDEVAGRVFDVGGCFAGLPPGTQVYACGPKPMLKAAMEAARRLGWPRDRLAFELFYSVAAPKEPT